MARSLQSFTVANIAHFSSVWHIKIPVSHGLWEWAPPGNWNLWRQKLISERYWDSLVEARFDRFDAAVVPLWLGWVSHLELDGTSHWWLKNIPCMTGLWLWTSMDQDFIRKSQARKRCVKSGSIPQNLCKSIRCKHIGLYYIYIEPYVYNIYIYIILYYILYIIYILISIHINEMLAVPQRLSASWAKRSVVVRLGRRVSHFRCTPLERRSQGEVMEKLWFFS